MNLLAEKYGISEDQVIWFPDDDHLIIVDETGNFKRVRIPFDALEAMKLESHRDIRRRTRRAAQRLREAISGANSIHKRFELWKLGVRNFGRKL